MLLTFSSICNLSFSPLFVWRWNVILVKGKSGFYINFETFFLSIGKYMRQMPYIFNWNYHHNPNLSIFHSFKRMNEEKFKVFFSKIKSCIFSCIDFVVETHFKRFYGLKFNSQTTFENFPREFSFVYLFE